MTFYGGKNMSGPWLFSYLYVYRTITRRAERVNHFYKDMAGNNGTLFFVVYLVDR